MRNDVAHRLEHIARDHSPRPARKRYPVNSAHIEMLSVTAPSTLLVQTHSSENGMITRSWVFAPWTSNARPSCASISFTTQSVPGFWGSRKLTTSAPPFEVAEKLS